jgi:biphenyl 2,3-dioxygenase ferredoxin subunit
MQNKNIIEPRQLSNGVRTMSETCQRIALCPRTQVEQGKAIRIEKDGLSLAVFNLEGEFFVTDDQCTHGPGSLSEGCIEGDVVECDFHNGAFNIRTGEVAAAPCMVPLRTYRTVVNEDGFVSIEF